MKYYRVNKTITLVHEIGEFVVLHKGNYLERHVQWVCPLEIQSAVKEDQEIHSTSNKENDHKNKRQERKSAPIAKEKIKE